MGGGVDGVRLRGVWTVGFGGVKLFEWWGCGVFVQWVWAGRGCLSSGVAGCLDDVRLGGVGQCWAMLFEQWGCGVFGWCEIGRGCLSSGIAGCLDGVVWMV
ncbi:MAG: hypothetical protein LBQ31_00480 [Bacteroidales bacterium]|nr:hypothetical protein [Bacteroidales bacterium]